MARMLRVGMRGRDVLALQRAVNRRLRRWRLPTIAEDGIYGQGTRIWAKRVAYLLGLHRGQWVNGTTPYAQAVIAGRRRRTVRARARARARRPWGRRLRRRYARPRIVGWGQSGIRPPWNVPLGPTTRATTHYAASPRARTLGEGLRLARMFDRFHRSKGWGGIAYHFLIPDTGELILGRSTAYKGTHVAYTNSNNVGINFFSGPGHRPTAAQRRTALWLVRNAHTRALPRSHRVNRDLRRADIRGHRFWPNQSTGCPGHFTPRNLGID